MLKDVSDERRWRALVRDARASLVADANGGLTAMKSILAREKTL
jgi:hypothetical protein